MINTRIQPKRKGIISRALEYVNMKYAAPIALALGASSCAIDGQVSGGASLMLPHGSNSSETEYSATLGLQGSLGLRTKKGFGLKAKLNMSQSESRSGNTENLDVMTDLAGEVEVGEIGGVKVVPYVEAGNLFSISDTYIPGVADDTHTSNAGYIGIGCNLEGKRWYAGIERIQFGIGEEPANIDSLWLLQGGVKYKF